MAREIIINIYQAGIFEAEGNKSRIPGRLARSP